LETNTKRIARATRALADLKSLNLNSRACHGTIYQTCKQLKKHDCEEIDLGFFFLVV
jgi:hypothetical protein